MSRTSSRITSDFLAEHCCDLDCAIMPTPYDGQRCGSTQMGLSRELRRVTAAGARRTFGHYRRLATKKRLGRFETLHIPRASRCVGLRGST